MWPFFLSDWDALFARYHAGLKPVRGMLDRLNAVADISVKVSVDYAFLNEKQVLVEFRRYLPQLVVGRPRVALLFIEIEPARDSFFEVFGTVIENVV